MKSLILPCLLAGIVLFLWRRQRHLQQLLRAASQAAGQPAPIDGHQQCRLPMRPSPRGSATAGADPGGVASRLSSAYNTTLAALAALSQGVRQHMSDWEQDVSLREQYSQKLEPQAQVQPPPDDRQPSKPEHEALAQQQSGRLSTAMPPASTTPEQPPSGLLHTFPLIASRGLGLGGRWWSGVPPQLPGPKPWPVLPPRGRQLPTPRWANQSQVLRQERLAATMPAPTRRSSGEDLILPLRRLSTALRSLRPSWLAAHAQGSQDRVQPPSEPSSAGPAAAASMQVSRLPATWRPNHALDSSSSEVDPAHDDLNRTPLRRLSSLIRRLSNGALCTGVSSGDPHPAAAANSRLSHAAPHLGSHPEGE